MTVETLPFPFAPHPTRQERRNAGKALRLVVPRAAHAQWSAPADRPDPVELLRRTSRGRLPDFVPIRYGRMVASPFAFFRGAAAQMAHDLSSTPVSGLRVQAVGDAHLMNFGSYATPERNLVFDVNDFDETLPAPWEWDVKRFAASVVVAGRFIGLREEQARDACLAGVRAYRLRLRDYARMTHLEVWYDRIDAHEAIEDIARHARKHAEAMFDKARTRTSLQALSKLARQQGGQWRIVDDPPLVTHVRDERVRGWIEALQGGYFDTVPEDRRSLLERYTLADWALRVTGVGSAGRRSLILLLSAGDDDVLFLQIKEARRSVLEAFAGPCSSGNPAQRIVRGQRLIQAASDPFLGWVHGRLSFYVRQLRDMKGSFELEDMSGSDLLEYAELCGWALARAHARSGDAAALCGYLGKSEAFDTAIVAFAARYADQTERDHAALERAVREGRLEVITGV
ncbi:uncharacterized protein (DUF2252 family) [Deinobacterium chartae]|uniref:Uncharacterized protein (DUF2252 family) n=1 Tax=Deinobacterium chartae TaxID=521158 RepID=A0A841I2N0_9DEIO|nr:DUF2252 domain-containing protein [Deinobacterium chartae]MBB6098302.1 uncharacterized protein (DUF2252 family) [Deinobacterium chartae]